MALLRCEDCGREVSDVAVACPNCGRPIAAQIGPPRAIQTRATNTIAGLKTIGGLMAVAGVIVFAASSAIGSFGPLLGIMLLLVGFGLFIAGRVQQ
jgi:hypothetical protein